jgi:VWFA-related protein
MICPRKILSLGLAAWLAAPGFALPQQEDPRTRIRTTVEMVVVPVTVKDRQGRLVADVRQEEFRLLEDSVEQKIAVFAFDPFPLSAVVLLDNALKKQNAEQVLSSLRAIAGGFSEFDEVAICRFDTIFEPGGDFTTDNDKLLTQLKRLDLDQTFPGQGSGPMTSGPRINGGASTPGAPSSAQIRLGGRETKNINDAVYAAGQLLRGRERGRRKIIYLISDGHNSRNNTYSFDDTIKLLLSADISVYAIGVGDAALDRGIGVLSRFAHATGGDVFYAAKRAELESLYARVSEQARNQYTLAYVPEKTDRKLEYHTIEVRVRRPGLVLLARDGYYTPPKP